jgi:hypothetical protein
VMPFTSGVYLIVGPELEHTANTIVSSVQVPGTADNDANTIRQRIKVIVANWATAGSTKWVLMPQEKSDHYAHAYVVKEPFVGMEKVAEGHVKIVHQSIKGYGVELPYNTVGSEGA